MAIYKKIEDLPDAYTEMLANAANKVMNATQILQNFVVVFFLGSIINVGVRKYSFLTPFLHKKVDIDGIHSYN